MLSPNYLFDSPWTPKINNIHANATSTTTNNVSNPTTTTTTTATSNVSHTGGDTSDNLNSGYGHRGKRKEESNKVYRTSISYWWYKKLNSFSYLFFLFFLFVFCRSQNKKGPSGPKKIVSCLTSRLEKEGHEVCEIFGWR